MSAMHFGFPNLSIMFPLRRCIIIEGVKVWGRPHKSPARVQPDRGAGAVPALQKAQRRRRRNRRTGAATPTSPWTKPLSPRRQSGHQRGWRRCSCGHLDRMQAPGRHTLDLLLAWGQRGRSHSTEQPQPHSHGPRTCEKGKGGVSLATRGAPTWAGHPKCPGGDAGQKAPLPPGGHSHTRAASPPCAPGWNQHGTEHTPGPNVHPHPRIFSTSRHTRTLRDYWLSSEHMGTSARAPLTLASTPMENKAPCVRRKQTHKQTKASSLLSKFP